MLDMESSIFRNWLPMFHKLVHGTIANGMRFLSKFVFRIFKSFKSSFHVNVSSQIKIWEITLLWRISHISHLVLYERTNGGNGEVSAKRHSRIKLRKVKFFLNDKKQTNCQYLTPLQSPYQFFLVYFLLRCGHRLHRQTLNRHRQTLNFLSTPNTKSLEPIFTIHRATA